jgi:hypothetical protein
MFTFADLVEKLYRVGRTRRARDSRSGEINDERENNR